ncbi:hypothetical protein Q2941_17220 [Bradyrhizobium sp. UFLA05-153]
MKAAHIAIALLVIQCLPAQAAEPSCMNDYYRNKRPACVDSILSQVRDAPSWPKSEPMTLIGFLAQLFRSSPDEKQRVLAASEPSEYLRGLYLQVLHRAGLHDDAENYARAHRMLPGLRNLEIAQPTPLDEVRPSLAPGDNDLLIGAYMASGDTVFIERILENFSSADDSLASDGLRMGLMQYKFGPTFVPKDRKEMTAAAACAKYQCKTNPAKFYRLLTLSTAIWVMQALRNDEGVNRTVDGFFGRDKRLKELLAAEKAALGNYQTALVFVTAFKPDHASMEADQAYAAMSKSASIYETLGSPRDVVAPIETLAKSGKKPN